MKLVNLINFQMEQFTQELGLIIKEKVMVYKYGKMVQNMKENGKIMRLTEKENSIMQMGIITKDNGQEIKQMATEYICMLTVLYIKVLQHQELFLIYYNYYMNFSNINEFIIF